MNTQTHNIPSLEEAIDFSKSKNWSESCTSFIIGTLVQVVGGKELNEGYLFGRVVKETSKFIWIFCANGKTQQKSKKYVELAQTSRQQDAVASTIPQDVPSVDVSQTSRQQDAAASIIPEAVPSVDVSQTSRQQDAAVSIIPEAVPSVDVSQTSRQQDAAVSIIPEAVPSVDVSQTSRQQDAAASTIPEAVPSVDVSQTSRQPFATLSSDPNVSFGGRKNEKRKRCVDAQDRRIIQSKKNRNRLNANVRKKPRLDNVINWGKSVPSFSSGSPCLTSKFPAANKKSVSVLRKTPGHHLKRRSMQKHSKQKDSPLVRSAARDANGFDFSASREKLSPNPRSNTYDAIRFDFGLKIEYNQSPTNSFPRERSSKRDFVDAARAILESSAVEKSKVTGSVLGQIPPPPGFSALDQHPHPPVFVNGASADEKEASRATVRPPSGLCPIASSEKKKSTRDAFDSIFGI